MQRCRKCKRLYTQLEFDFLEQVELYEGSEVTWPKCNNPGCDSQEFDFVEDHQPSRRVSSAESKELEKIVKGRA